MQVLLTDAYFSLVVQNQSCQNFLRIPSTAPAHPLHIAVPLSEQSCCPCKTKSKRRVNSSEQAACMLKVVNARDGCYALLVCCVCMSAVNQKQPHFPLLALTSRIQEHPIPADRIITANPCVNKQIIPQAKSRKAKKMKAAQESTRSVPLPLLRVNSSWIGK